MLPSNGAQYKVGRIDTMAEELVGRTGLSCQLPPMLVIGRDGNLRNPSCGPIRRETRASTPSDLWMTIAVSIFSGILTCSLPSSRHKRADEDVSTPFLHAKKTPMSFHELRGYLWSDIG